MTTQADRSHPVVAHRRRSNPTVATAGFRGVAIVEFAFVAIILSVMVAATVDYGRGWQSSLAVTEASRTGARRRRARPTAPRPTTSPLTDPPLLQASNKIDDVELW
jgi:Flp pilus assembly protein TadG